MLSLAQVSLAISPGGSEHKLIDQLGLRAAPAADCLPGTRALHYTFTTTRLELRWLEDEAALPQAAAAFGLRERLRWPETGASPFALVFDLAAGAAAPVATEPFAIDGAANWQLASSCRQRHDEPLLAFTAATAAAMATAGARARRHSGIGDITGVELTLPGTPSADLRALADGGRVTLRSPDAGGAPAAHLSLVLDGGRGGRRIDLSPLLPLGFVV
jgi:hypothetical protein